MIIIGVDETGRGALAGPLVVAATAFSSERTSVSTVFHDRVLTAGDSKSFTDSLHREALDTAIRAVSLATTVVVRSSAEIDKQLMYAAYPETIRLVISRCIEQLQLSMPDRNPDQYLVKIDGNVELPNLPCPYEAIVDGDKSVWQIGAASIVAKVYRDAYMMKLHLKYPQWEFDKSKGYPTPEHRRLLGELDLTPEHRKSFKPVALANGVPLGIEV